MGHRKKQDGCIVITEAELVQELKRLGESAEVLTERQARRWAMRQRGMSYGQISRAEGVDLEAVRRACMVAEGKLRKGK